MTPALTVLFASSLGCGPADVQALEPAQLLVEALASELGACLEPGESSAPGPGEPLSVWYPVSLADLTEPAPRPEISDARALPRLDWRLPWILTKP